MQTRIFMLALALSAATLQTQAADGGRTYANPACSARDANPEDCVIQDGPPRRPPIPALRRAHGSGAGGAAPPTTPPPSDSGPASQATRGKK